MLAPASIFDASQESDGSNQRLVRSIFIDMNSYYASVEQELNPGLRDKPVGVVPINVDSSCCIATSYEAKRYGVMTGTLVSEARRKCPGIELVTARHQVYVEFHHRIVAAVESCLPVATVRSIDEMDCTLIGRERNPAEAVKLAQRIKAAIREHAGSSLRCSVGIAPNSFLAKIAAEMHKPDGLTQITRPDLPEALYDLNLRDIPGIGKQMFDRVHRGGIRTVQQLCELPRKEMRRIWGGITGERIWHWLRGDDVPEPARQKRVVGHSHVLAPEFRTPEATYAVLQKLVLKATLRLRKMGYQARRLSVHIRRLDHTSWEAGMKVHPSQDDMTMLHALEKLWRNAPDQTPLGVSISFSQLVPHKRTSQDIFADHRRDKLIESLDAINDRFGTATVYFGSIHGVKSAAPTRIGFTNIPDTFW